MRRSLLSPIVCVFVLWLRCASCCFQALFLAVANLCSLSPPTRTQDERSSAAPVGAAQWHRARACRRLERQYSTCDDSG
jgi:hypothetical protein